MKNHSKFHPFTIALLIAIVFCGASPARSAADEPQSQFRRPVAVQLSESGDLLYVANRRSGTISIIDLKEKAVAKEYKIGKRVSDLTAVPNRPVMLATDEQTHELLVLSVKKLELSVTQRLKVNQYPVTVVATSDGKHAFVASLWSRRLTFVDLPAKENDKACVTGQLDMPFAPRVQLLVDNDSRLIVADSFGGRLGVVDCESQRLLHVREFPGHNIRGLGVSRDGEMLLVSHQMLNELAHTVRNDVHWGLLMSNDLRWLKLRSVLDDSKDLYKGAHMHPLGEAGRASGDPAGLAVALDGTVVATIGGTDEISFGKENDFSLYRLNVGSSRPAERVGRESRSEAAPTDSVGRDRRARPDASEADEYGPVRRLGPTRRRPTAVAISHDSRQVYVANTFGDTISIVDLKEHETIDEISLGPQPKLTLADRGELLFFDARLSHDSWMSCHSCHTDGHTNGMLNDNLSDGSFGAPKRVLSLLGRADTAPFAWNGGAKNFADQIRKSITNTMQGDQPPTQRQVAALSAYLETLAPPPPIDLARGERDEKAIQRGQALFVANRCDRCHAPPTYTTPRLYAVGLKDKLGNERFNPPTLRGVGQRGPYFHDGQAKTLEEVFRKFKHKVPEDLSDEQLKDLIAFLRSL